MPIDSARVNDLALRAEEYLETKYRLPVHIRAIPKPFHGDLDGAEIDIDGDTEAAARLSVLLHPFAHTAQRGPSARAGAPARGAGQACAGPGPARLGARGGRGGGRAAARARRERSRWVVQRH